MTGGAHLRELALEHKALKKHRSDRKHCIRLQPETFRTHSDVCSDLVTTMCDDLYDNVQMLTNSVIVKCKASSTLGVNIFLR